MNDATHNYNPADKGKAFNEEALPAWSYPTRQDREKAQERIDALIERTILDNQGE
jgi:hypothetical protein